METSVNNKCRAFTSLEQSKKLAEILPIESADMFWKNGVSDKYIQCFTPFVIDKDVPNVDFVYDVPCWSLTALLGVLPKIGAEEPIVRKLYYASKPVERYICEYSLTNMTSEYDNPVDACVAMIEKLHELSLL